MSKDEAILKLREACAVAYLFVCKLTPGATLVGAEDEVAVVWEKTRSALECTVDIK
jgi:hypothetical protein